MIEKLRVIAEAWGIPFEELLHALVVEDSNDDGSSKFGLCGELGWIRF